MSSAHKFFGPGTITTKVKSIGCIDDGLIKAKVTRERKASSENTYQKNVYTVSWSNKNFDNYIDSNEKFKVTLLSVTSGETKHPWKKELVGNFAEIREALEKAMQEPENKNICRIST